MDWRRGFSAEYYATYVDSSTWRDGDRFEIIDGSVKREMSSLQASADIKCKNYNDTSERLIRIWLDTRQKDEEPGHIPLFTGYTSSPDRNIDGTVEYRTLQCYSVLLPASDILLPRGWYAPVGIDGTVLIESLLRCTNAPMDVSTAEDDNRSLKQAIVAEDNETKLSMVEKILSAMNWRMKIDGYGEIHIEPYNPEPVAVFSAVDNDVIETSVTVNYDWFSCPNVVRVVMDDNVATARDEDSDTPMSIQNRGREVWYEETDVVLNDRETLQEYAVRHLKELQRVSMEVKYDRRFHPDIYPLDIIGLNYPRQNLVGTYYITSQSISLSFGAKTSEEVQAAI